jgi:hypothetical protein
MTNSSNKIRVAPEALKRRTDKSRNGQVSRPAPVPGCVTKLDRLQLYCDDDPTDELMAVPSLKSRRGHRINRPADGRFQAYGRVHWFDSHNSEMKLLIEIRTAGSLAASIPREALRR